MLYEKVSKLQNRMLGSHRSDSAWTKRPIFKIKHTQTTSVTVDYRSSMIKEEIFTIQQGRD